MILKFLNPQIMFVIIGIFLGYFIIPELLFSFFKIIIDKSIGAVIGAAIGYFMGKHI